MLHCMRINMAWLDIQKGMKIFPNLEHIAQIHMKLQYDMRYDKVIQLTYPG